MTPALPPDPSPDAAQRSPAEPPDTSGVWAVGVDGGGTRGRAWAAPASHAGASRPAGTATVERSCNPYAVGVEAAAASLLALLDDAWRQGAGPADGLSRAFVTIGLAGVDRDAERRAMTTALVAGGLAADRLELVGDPWIALEGALPATDAPSAYDEAPPTVRVLLVAGTGSVAVGVAGAVRVRVGGWGSRVGDEGSGAWLGIEAVRAALRACDGRDPDGALARAVQGTWGAGVDALVGRARTATPAEFAALAPLVLEHAAADPTARSLRDGAVAYLAELVATVATALERTGGRPPNAIALAGGVATALEEPIGAALTASLRTVVRRAVGEPVAGAWSLARARALASESGIGVEVEDRAGHDPQGRTTI